MFVVFLLTLGVYFERLISYHNIVVVKIVFEFFKVVQRRHSTIMIDLNLQCVRLDENVLDRSFILKKVNTQKTEPNARLLYRHTSCGNCYYD